MLRVEQIKKMNLAEFLSRCYGLSFERSGDAYVCLSPFTEESRPSFFVRLVDGHWVFKDHSGGLSGTVFDFVQMKENLPDFRSALQYIRELLTERGNGMFLPAAEQDGAADRHSKSEKSRSVNIQQMYECFRGNDVSPCRDYLLSRNLSQELVEELIDRALVVHNRYKGRSYCCFAVFDAEGTLQCLDNHEIGGSGKFVLGRKVPFSLEWQRLASAQRVYISESIIDYLSVKTLEGLSVSGLALLGNQADFEPGLCAEAETVVAAVDSDDGGASAVVDLQQIYPDRHVRMYELEGHKDPNDLLNTLTKGKGRKLTAESKTRLYRDYLQANNKTDVARRWNIDRSYMYEIVQRCEDALEWGLADRRPGPKTEKSPRTLEEARERIQQLEEYAEQKATEYESAYCENEFLKLHLKWAREDAEERQQQKASEGVKTSKAGKNRQKRHAKKKKKKKR